MAENLRIAIIGAGMGGLATALSLAKAGHKNITVYEHASNLGFVGAGIQLAPNMAKILDKMGVWSQIAAEAVQCANTSIREGASDKELGYVDLGYVKEKYGYPHMVGHRASLAAGLYEGCQRSQASHSSSAARLQTRALAQSPHSKSHPPKVARLSLSNATSCSAAMVSRATPALPCSRSWVRQQLSRTPARPLTASC